MRRVIINGANGYVASHFISELLVNGYDVVALVRERSNATSEQRMHEALEEIDARFDSANLEVCSYSLLDKNYALTSQQLKEIFNGEIDFFHFAACLKFKSRDRDVIFETNVNGVENSVQVFKNNASADSRFFLAGTAYSCGKNTDLFKEKFYENTDISAFRNYYEQSKRYAENVIKKYIEEEDLNAHILRLSQVVGDNKTGVITTNYGIFDFIKKLQTFSDKFPNEKIRVKIDPDSTQNLIPVDKVVSYLMKSVQKDELPVIMNFVGRQPMKNRQILSSVCDLLPVEIVPEKELNKKDMSRHEKMIASGMSFGQAYADIKLKFDTSNLEKYFSPNGNEINRDSLHKMIKYFVEHQRE